jgi:FkbM family methyltransferase
MQKLNGLKFLWGFQNFWDLAVRRIAAKYRDVSIYDLLSGPAIVDRQAGDTNGVWACLHWGEYDNALSAIELKISNRNRVAVLDCGANAGGFGLLLAKKGFIFREYHAVEMNPRAFGRAAFNLTNWRGQTPARMINAAVTKESGWVTISDSFGDTGQSIYRASVDSDDQKVKVPKITISTLLSEESWPLGLPELIKLDIEGAEFDAIPQLTNEMLRGTRAIIVEIHPLRNIPAIELVNYLRVLGFECKIRPAGEWGVYAFLKI